MLTNTQTVKIIKRPSAYCKTPYVADISIDDVDYLAHCPALGCCGLSDKDANVIVVPIESEKTKCKFRVELAFYKDRGQETIVGINPKLAEKIMENMLSENNCPFMKIKNYKREQKMLNSRFDFMGIDIHDREFVLEIKNVPLADYVDVPKKDRKKINTDHIPYDEKIAYFPDGYRKNSTELVSPRAFKHIQELEKIVKTTNYRAILCFMVQRTDVSCFQPSNIDLQYKKAVIDAWLNGVEIYAIQIKWHINGTYEFIKLLPVRLFDYEGPILVH